MAEEHGVCCFPVTCCPCCLGRAQYKELFPDVCIADLYQNPASRPRRGVMHCPTLTTGCARMFVFPLNRFAHGSELLVLHGIPVFRILSSAMGCAQIRVNHMSHRLQSKLAGNSMHCACVGLITLAALLFAGKA